MRACVYVGRVGGLALALGVGAAVLGGTAIGWADDETTSGSAAGHGSGQTQVTSRTPRGGTGPSATGTGDFTASPPGRRSPGAAEAADATQQRDFDSPAVDSPAVGSLAVGSLAVDTPDDPADIAVDPAPAEPIVTVEAAPGMSTTAEPVAAADRPAPEATHAAVMVPLSAPEPVAAPPSQVASVPSGTVAALDDSLAGRNPGGVPADTPLDWTVLAYTRRHPMSAASTPAAGPAAATTAPLLPIIMGASGVPIPSPAYGNTVMDYYITPVTPGPILPQQLLFTPEGLYPITGVKSLPLNTSVDQGLRILNSTLADLAPQSPVTVFGYSQSSIISSLLQGGYTVDINNVPTYLDVPANVADSINFILVGNEMNPDGGFLSRFSGRDMPLLTLESLGIPFYGPTPGGPVPPNGVQYPTTNYAREYDGFADFPRYPINLLADLNAGLGIVYVHVQYAPVITQAECAKKAFCLLQTEVEAARAYNQLPTTSPSQKYYFIPTENLPLLQPLRDIPLIGNPIADLIQPSLKALVDFGYADPAHGYTTATQPYANELQPFDFLPPANLYPEAFQRFFDGIGQGIKDFIDDLGPNGSVAEEISRFALPDLGPLAMGASGGFISSVQQLITSVTDYISGTAAGLYAALLPTADIINALVISLPAYATNLFLYGMQEAFSGNVIQGLSDAVGLPIAATVGLSSTAALVGALVWGQAILPAFPRPIPEG